MSLTDGRGSQKLKSSAYDLEKSDTLIVPQKWPNNQTWAEAVEGRGARKYNMLVLTLRIRSDA
jgi:hypothetical protein